MMFIDINGRKKDLRKIEKYLINWDGKSASNFQKSVKDLLYYFWGADVVFEELPVIGTRLTLDFYNSNKKIALEVDGKQHYQYNKFFHRGNRGNFLDQIRRDEQKEEFCEWNEIVLVRILEEEDLTKELVASRISHGL